MAIAAINQKIGNGLNKVAESSMMQKRFEVALSDPAKFAAGMLVTSIVSKDLVGCALYTTQSLNNKKIPEDKRTFVAMLDGVNGFLMVFGQLAIGKLIERHYTPKTFAERFSGVIKDVDTKAEKPLLGADARNSALAPNNLTGQVKEVFSGKDDKEISKKARKIRRELASNGIDFEELKKLRPEELQLQIDKVTKALIGRVGPGSAKFKAIETGFALLVGAIATTAITKRTLVPLVATPIAGAFNDKFEKSKKAKLALTPTMIDSTMAKTQSNKPSKSAMV